MENKKRVVITGIGPIASTGIGKEHFWEGVLDQKTGLSPERVKIDGEVWDDFHLHKVDGFDMKDYGIKQDLLDDLKSWKKGEEIIDLFYIIAAVKLALDDSRLKYDQDNNEIGLILVHENPGLEQFFQKFCNDAFDLDKDKLTRKQFFEAIYQKEARSAYDLQTFMFLFQVAKIFDIHGYSLFLNNACASGLYALEAAAQTIKSGKNPVVIVAGADCPKIYKYLWFEDLGMYAKDGVCKPFSKDANGIVFGEGGIGFILEDMDHALERGADIYAEYMGGGFSMEGWKVTLPAVGSDYYQKAIRQAIETSHVSRNDIDLICAHGVGNTVIDRYETKAVKDVFGPDFDNVLVTAFKPLIGHTLGISALIETAILINCLNNNVAVPLLYHNNIDPRHELNFVKEKIDVELNTVLKICSAFAGYNGALVLKKFKG